MSARPPRVLVLAASRHGATAEIAAALASALAECETGRAGGLTAIAMPVEQRPDATAFDAVILGSAVYAGHWLDPAREYAATHADVLRRRPVWLFSSGPIGEPPFPRDEPYDVVPLMQLIGARGHRVFAGRLDASRLSFGERAMVTAMRAPLGDFRDWDAVRAWATEIAGSILTPAGAPSVPG
jgi:menaquinone-dependent protoporphyrinogen oxidase